MPAPPTGGPAHSLAVPGTRSVGPTRRLSIHFTLGLSFPSPSFPSHLGTPWVYSPPGKEATSFSPSRTQVCTPRSDKSPDPGQHRGSLPAFTFKCDI